MHQSTTSRFSWVIDPTAMPSGAPSDTELERTDSFVLVPSLGSIVPGWVLAVPRRPIINLAQLTKSEGDELDRLVIHAAKKLRAFSGKIFCFEHGATQAGSAAGCGVDQAHLHIVPLPFDLLARIRNSTDLSVNWRANSESTSLWPQLPRSAEYMVARDISNSETLIGLVTEPTSQWMRKVIASETGKEKEWNYNMFPYHENISSTIKEYKK